MQVLTVMLLGKMLPFLPSEVYISVDDFGSSGTDQPPATLGKCLILQITALN